MEIVDSHCHLDYPPLSENLDRVLELARQEGVAWLLTIAVNMENWPVVIAIAEKYPNVCASIGVHPSEVEGREPDIRLLLEFAGHERVVAIGETGLDYHYNQGDLEWQRNRFRCHIAAARQCNKPLVIHSRDANSDTISILREERASECGGVLHCFSGDWIMARAALDMGFYISLSGIVTFKNADNLRSIARKLPADRLLIETDSPYLAPVPHRGKSNQPAFLRDVLDCLAVCRGSNVEKLARMTTRNFFRLFRTFPV